MVQHAKSLNLPNCNFMLCDILDYCSDQMFDAVIAFDSLWHVDHENQPKLYPKIAGLLNVGGYFMFTHGRTDSEIVGNMFNESFYHSALDLDCLKNLLAENGFRIVKCIEDYREQTTGSRDLLVVAQKMH